jgi:uncharacterized protein YndB with AHSA1/START domain
MVATQEIVTPAKDRDVVIVRVFNAPPEAVFRAWTDPKYLKRWFAPNGCAVSFPRLDVRTGGNFHSCIRTPGGHECWCVGVYEQVVAPERIVYTAAMSDADGNLRESVDAGMEEDWPKETRVTVTFEDLGGKTRMVLTQSVLESLAKRTGAYPSWLEMFDRLEEELTTG